MSDELKYLYLKNHPLFATLHEDHIHHISCELKVKKMVRGEMIGYGQGPLSRIFFVAKGKIKLTETDDMEHERVKDILPEGEIFGDLGLEGDTPSAERAEALTANTVVCYFPVAAFRRILEHHPIVAMSYVSRVSSKLKRLEDRHADLVLHDARARLIRFIKNWARTDGSRIGNKIVLNNYLTHSDIAGIISTSRQSVNVLLNELRDSGKLHYNRKRIELTDAAAWN